MANDEPVWLATGVPVSARVERLTRIGGGRGEKIALAAGTITARPKSISHPKSERGRRADGHALSHVSGRPFDTSPANKADALRCTCCKVDTRAVKGQIRLTTRRGRREMAVPEVQCSIGGKPVAYAELASIQFHRHLHVLHQMRRLGATITRDGVSLSDDDIDLLSSVEARDLSVAARRSFDMDGITALYATQLRASDHFWKEIAATSAGLPTQTAFADLTITGISLDEFQAIIDLEHFHQYYAEMHPDHYFLVDDGGGLHHMETFGMYGSPTELRLHIDPAMPDPIERDPDFPSFVAGYATLASDGSRTGVFAAHQFRPIQEGLEVKLGCVFPAMSPPEMVEAHSGHMAIEFWELIRVVTAG